MPKNHRSHNKRHNRSQRKNTNQPARGRWLTMRSRARFLPAIIITIFATFLWAQPQFALFGKSYDVLAYATDVSPGGLLSATNTQRGANGVGTLTLNSKLNAAAQAKANDMVNRNYWSHQTPDGQQPWIFITNAGYQYLSAGENLAYGFTTSSSTITGWMNSPSHKANLLASNFTEVGFGITNSADYMSTGPQTVVVAMYAKPQGAPAPPAPTPTPPAPQPVTSQPKVKQQNTNPTEADEEPKPTETPVVEETVAEAEAEEEPKDEEIIAVTNTETTNSAGSANVQRIQILTGGSAVWSATFVILTVCAVGILWAIHKGIHIRTWVKASEKFIGQHIHLDLTVLSIIYLGFVLLSTSGTIR